MTSPWVFPSDRVPGCRCAVLGVCTRYFIESVHTWLGALVVCPHGVCVCVYVRVCRCGYIRVGAWCANEAVCVWCVGCAHVTTCVGVYETARMRLSA